MRKSNRIEFRCTDKLKKDLDRASEQRGKSISSIIEDAINTYLQNKPISEPVKDEVKVSEPTPPKKQQKAAKHSYLTANLQKGERYFDEATGLWRRK